MHNLPSDLIVFDLETNQPTHTIIEIGAVRLLRNLAEPIDTFQSLVRLENERLNNDVAALTGISNSTLHNAPKWSNVAQRFADWARRDTSNVILASWSPYDVFQLRYQWPKNQKYPFRNSMLDIKSFIVLFSHFFGPKPPKHGGLAKYTEHYNNTLIPPQHRALADARTTAELLRTVKKHVQTTKNVVHDFFA